LPWTSPHSYSPAFTVYFNLSPRYPVPFYFLPF